MLSEAVVVLGNKSHIHNLFVMGDIFDHEGAVSFVFISNETGPSSVLFIYKFLILVINQGRFVFVININILSKKLPLNLNVSQGVLCWIGESTWYDNRFTLCCFDVSRDSYIPALPCSRPNQTKIHISIVIFRNDIMHISLIIR